MTLQQKLKSPTQLHTVPKTLQSMPHNQLFLAVLPCNINKILSRPMVLWLQDQITELCIGAAAKGNQSHLMNENNHDFWLCFHVMPIKTMEAHGIAVLWTLLIDTALLQDQLPETITISGVVTQQPIASNQWKRSSYWLCCHDMQPQLKWSRPMALKHLYNFFYNKILAQA